MWDRYENIESVFILLRRKIAAHALALGDFMATVARADIGTHGLPRPGHDFGRGDRQFITHVIAFDANAFADMNVAIIRHAQMFGGGDPGLRQNADRVDDQRVAFPVADRMAVEVSSTSFGCGRPSV